MEDRSSELEKSNSERKDAYKVKKKTMDLLPDAQNNIAKLQVKIHHIYFVARFGILK